MAISLQLSDFSGQSAVLALQQLVEKW